MSDETPRIPDPAEAARLLRHQLAHLGPDTDRSVMLTIRLADGTYVGDVWLSTADTTALTDASVGIAMVANSEHYMSAAGLDDEDYVADAEAPLPLAEDDLTDEDIDDVVAGFATLLGSEDGEL